MTEISKIRYINLCIVEFWKRHRMSAVIAFNYLKEYKGLYFLEKCYESEHLLSLSDALNDLRDYCRKNGGTL